jgi:hypothetical protein
MGRERGRGSEGAAHSRRRSRRFYARRANSTFAEQKSCPEVSDAVAQEATRRSDRGCLPATTGVIAKNKTKFYVCERSKICCYVNLATGSVPCTKWSRDLLCSHCDDTYFKTSKKRALGIVRLKRWRSLHLRWLFAIYTLGFLVVGQASFQATKAETAQGRGAKKAALFLAAQGSWVLSEVFIASDL